MNKNKNKGISIVNNINQGAGRVLPQDTLQKMREILAESIARAILAKSLSDLHKSAAAS